MFVFDIISKTNSPEKLNNNYNINFIIYQSYFESSQNGIKAIKPNYTHICLYLCFGG